MGGFFATSTARGSSAGSSQICPGDTFRYITAAESVAGLNAANDKKPETIRVRWDRHNQGANYTFADGHAKWMRLEATLDPSNYLWGEAWYPAPFQNSPIAAPCN